MKAYEEVKKKIAEVFKSLKGSNKIFSYYQLRNF